MLAIIRLIGHYASMNPEMPAHGHDEHDEDGRSRGGRARAEKLSPSERSAISRKAALARWEQPKKMAICGSEDQPLVIGDVELTCYVLDDGTRVLTQASFLQALGRHRRANTRSDSGVPPILQGRAIAPFIPDAVMEKARPITFQLPNGSRASGYNAELLPAVCEIYLAAREEGALPYQQLHVARQAEVLVRGLARVGIIALVDEATGYQEVRQRDALARILEEFVAKELQPWVKTFPPDYYEQMFRLRGLDYDTDNVKRPQYFGVLTNNVIYDRLAPGVRAELKRKVPKTDDGRPKARLHQQLTPDTGHPKLREHLASVISIMKLSDNWTDFMDKIDRIHPKFGSTIPLPLMMDDDKGL